MTNTEPSRQRPGDAAAAAALLTPEAVRAQCAAVLEAGLAGRLAHFDVDLDRLPDAAAAVCAVMRERYPDLSPPPHARWRHFAAPGPDGAAEDRWAAAAAARGLFGEERARAECELAIVSVLLDAGAGAAWRYRDGPTGATLARSEGLAIASLDLYLAGAFSSRSDAPLRADAEGLARFDADALEAGFQVGPTNPLEGAAGRAALIQRLGAAVAARPETFGGRAGAPRLGAVADHLAAQAEDGRLPAREILITLLETLAPIWPPRLEMAGRPLGDVWDHPAAAAPGYAPGLVPFHKLSQWLAYSLIEPLERRGLEIAELDALTGLAEYRNGGLFVDAGVLRLRDPQAAAVAHPPSAPLIVEWRALTVALLDRAADAVRAALGRSRETLPLAAVLEGGTWAAGRRLAAERRPGGAPPIAILSDGSVF